MKPPKYTINRAGKIFSVSAEVFEYIRECHLKEEKIPCGAGATTTRDYLVSELNETEKGFEAVLTPLVEKNV